MCKAFSVLDGQGQRRPITTKAKRQVPFSVDAMMIAVSLKRLQSDHSGGWQCQTTAVYSSGSSFTSTIDSQVPSLLAMAFLNNQHV